MAIVLALTLASETSAGEFTVENRVVGTAVTIEVVDNVNSKVKTKFDLEPKTKKVVETTGTRMEVTVYEKGSKKEVASGTFPAGSTVIIEKEGTKWKLRGTR